MKLDPHFGTDVEFKIFVNKIDYTINAIYGHNRFKVERGGEERIEELINIRPARSEDPHLADHYIAAHCEALKVRNRKKYMSAPGS